MPTINPNMILVLASCRKDRPRQDADVLRQGSAIQFERIDLWRELDPQHVSARRTADSSALRKILCHCVANALHLSHQSRAQPLQVTIIAASLQEFCNHPLLQ